MGKWFLRGFQILTLSHVIGKLFAFSSFPQHKYEQTLAFIGEKPHLLFFVFCMFKLQQHRFHIDLLVLDNLFQVAFVICSFYIIKCQAYWLYKETFQHIFIDKIHSCQMASILHEIRNFITSASITENNSNYVSWC